MVDTTNNNTDAVFSNDAFDNDAMQDDLVYSSSSAACPVCDTWNKLKNHEKVQAAVDQAQQFIHTHPELEAAYEKARPTLDAAHDVVSCITLSQVFAALGVVTGLRGLVQGFSTRKAIAHGDSKRAKRLALFAGLSAFSAGLWAVNTYLQQRQEQDDTLDSLFGVDADTDRFVGDYYDPSDDAVALTQSDNDEQPWIIDTDENTHTAADSDSVTITDTKGTQNTEL